MTVENVLKVVYIIGGMAMLVGALTNTIDMNTLRWCTGCLGIVIIMDGIRGDV